MPERREIHGGYDSRGRDGIINRNYGAAGLAATEKRFVILVQSQVPQDHALRPIPRCGNDQANLLLEQSSFLPLAAGTFRKPNVLVGKTWIRREFRCFRSKWPKIRHLSPKYLQQSLNFHKCSFSPPGVLVYESDGVSHSPTFG